MYSTNVNGQVLEFGTSGLLFRSNKLMYDRATLSLWHQFLGEPVVGPLANSGIKLEILPVLLTTWDEWLEAHPDTTVLDVDTGLYPPEVYFPEFDRRSIYYRHREFPGTAFPVWQRSSLLEEKAQVLGLTADGSAKAYPLELLKQQAVVNDSLGDLALVVVTGGEAGGARAYQRGPHRFTLRLEDSGERVDDALASLADERGGLWRVEEEALVNIVDPSQRLSRLGSHTAYWFGWYAFYPETRVYSSD